MKRLFVVVLALSIVGCAWWQKNEPKFECAGLATIDNAPALFQIVTQCAAIAVNAAAILPCVEGAAGSEWAQDVVKCFYQASLHKSTVVCPAYSAARVKAQR